MEEITATELKQRLDRGDDLQIVDVREQKEYDVARLEGSKLIPLGQVVNRINEIDPSRETVVHCKGGVRSAKAIEALTRSGFRGKLVNLKGGISLVERRRPERPEVLMKAGGWRKGCWVLGVGCWGRSKNWLLPNTQHPAPNTPF